MRPTALAVPVPEITPWRERFLQAAAGQIVFDSLHGRTGWTQAYRLELDSVAVGYGAVVSGGPWQGTRTIFEVYLDPEYHPHATGLFDALLQASAATHFEIQTEPPLLLELARRHVGPWTTERIIFRDSHLTTLLPPDGATFRQSRPSDPARLFEHRVEPVGDWVVELDGAIIATGGWLSHYNPPHRDLYMEVSEPFRRRGVGGWLLQELKRTCLATGGSPCARCSPGNTPSRRTLAKAGFSPWCEIVGGAIVRHPV